ncbi:MAG: penicillin-binding protein 1C [Verrucomicrobia bacterium]|nr:penicillin-binding protein 1C [Verrucomicrobiota bacterium]
MKIRATALLLALAPILVLAWAALEIAWRLTPVPLGLTKSPPESVEFVDRTGKPLRRILQEQRIYRSRCSLSDVSPNAIAATLSAEDKRFRVHTGIDVVAIVRALAEAIRTGQIRSGASTITEQLVKLSYPESTRGMWGKLTEAWAALSLERHWNKDRILEEYFNRLDYGDLQLGLASASADYFEKPSSDLSAAEAAFLAGIPQAPSRLDPFKHFDAAKARQRWVLGRMHLNGFLDDAAYARALVEPLRLRQHDRDFEAPLFVDLLLERRGTLPPDGGVVRTAVDLSLNRWIDDVIARQLQRLVDKNVTAAAAVVIDNSTGEVLALSGSGDYFEPGIGQINGAWNARSAGSALKPFTYVRALELGAFPGTVVADVPTDFPTDTGLYHPNNYNHRFYGPVTLRFALANSLNVAAIKVLEQEGGPDTLYSTLQRAGITTLEHSAAYYGLGLTIGNGEVRLLELANAYAALARLGVYKPFRLFVERASLARPTFNAVNTPWNLGLASEARSTESQRIFDERAAYLLVDMLSDNQARAGTFGLNSYLAFDFPVACKTGTSSNYRDNWTFGFTPEFTVGVWVGNPDNSPMRGITGVTGAAPIFHEIMVKLQDRYGTTWYHEPSGIEHCYIDPLTGHRVASDQPRAVQEIYAFAPESARPADYDSGGRVRLPEEYRAWVESDQNTLGDLLAGNRQVKHLRILEPAAGALYYFDRDLPANDQRLLLRAESTGQVEWSSPTLDIHSQGSQASIGLKEGRHEIAARDTLTGETGKIWIEVEPW